MTELQNLSDVIGHIYDTTLDRALWPKALGHVTKFADVYATSILKLHAAQGAEVLEEDNVIDPHYRRLYETSLVKIDPFFVQKLFMEPGEMLANTEMMPPEELWRTRIYREFAQPQGLLDCLNATLERTVGCTALVAFNLRRVVDDETKRRTRFLLPHIRRAVVIGGILDLHRAEAATFEAALDGLAAGIFFVDPDTRIKHANAAGHEMLKRQITLRTVGTKLAAYDQIADKALQTMVARAAEGDASLGTSGAALPLSAKDGHRHVAHVLPLVAGKRQRTAKTFTATAAVFVQPASREFVAPPVALARAFGLTIAETRVLVSIVDIGGVPAVADVLGVAEATIKVHLKSVYRKTGATRQADLVKLVAGFASPFGETDGSH